MSPDFGYAVANADGKHVLLAIFGGLATGIIITVIIGALL